MIWSGTPMTINVFRADVRKHDNENMCVLRVSCTSYSGVMGESGSIIGETVLGEGTFNAIM